MGRGWLLWAAMAAQATLETSIPSAGEVAVANPVARAVRGGAWEANPALSGTASSWRAGAGSTHPMGLSDLDLLGIWVGKGRTGWIPGWSLRWSNLEAGSLYREDRLDFDLATGNDRWQVGAGWRGGRADFGTARPDWIQGWAAGLLFRPLNLVTLGAAWEDLSGLRVPDPRLAQPWTARAGVAAVGSDSLWASQIGIEWKQDRSASWSFGQQLQWQIVVLRAGMRLEPWVLSFGAGIHWRNLVLDCAQQGDPRLGWQQHWTISVVR